MTSPSLSTGTVHPLALLLQRAHGLRLHSPGCRALLATGELGVELTAGLLEGGHRDQLRDIITLPLVVLLTALMRQTL